MCCVIKSLIKSHSQLSDHLLRRISSILQVVPKHSLWITYTKFVFFFFATGIINVLTFVYFFHKTGTTRRSHTKPTYKVGVCRSIKLI
jgi:hypothetical protein